MRRLSLRTPGRRPAKLRWALSGRGPPLPSVQSPALCASSWDRQCQFHRASPAGPGGASDFRYSLRIKVGKQLVGAKCTRFTVIKMRRSALAFTHSAMRGAWRGVQRSCGSARYRTSAVQQSWPAHVRHQSSKVRPGKPGLVHLTALLCPEGRSTGAALQAAGTGPMGQAYQSGKPPQASACLSPARYSSATLPGQARQRCFGRPECGPNGPLAQRVLTDSTNSTDIP